MKSQAYFLFFCLLLGSSCGKDNDGGNTTPVTKPPASNTMSATINGHHWGNCLLFGVSMGSKSSAEYYDYSGGLVVGGSNFCHDTYPYTGSDLVLYIKNVFDTGMYYIPGNYHSSAKYEISYSSTSAEYLTNDSNTGYLHLTKLDKANHLISGTFSFKAYCKDSNSTINLKNGSFYEIQYIY
jgi:hypothetical protein